MNARVLSEGRFVRSEGQWLSYAGRPAAASPAVGSARIHKLEQATLVSAAFEDL